LKQKLGTKLDKKYPVVPKSLESSTQSSIKNNAYKASNDSSITNIPHKPYSDSIS